MNSLKRVWVRTLIAGGTLALTLGSLTAQITVTEAGKVVWPYHLAYQPGRNVVVGSSFGVGRVTRSDDLDTDLWQIDLNIPSDGSTPSGNLSSFSTLPRTRSGWWTCYPMAVQRNLPNGFQRDEIFAFRREYNSSTSSWTYYVARYSPDGSSVNPNWANLSSLSDVRPWGMAMHIDHEGTWGHDILYVTERMSDYKVGRVFRIDSSGNVSYVADLPEPPHPDFRYPYLGVPRALSVIPNNPTHFGSLAGHLIIAREGIYGTLSTNSGDVSLPGSPIYTVDPLTNTSTFHGYVPIRIGGIQKVTGTYLLLSDWGLNTVWKLHVPDLSNYIGELVAVSTGSGYSGVTPGHVPGLYRLYYDGSNWQTQLLVDFTAYGIYAKDISVTFVPEPATLTVLGMGLAGLWASRRRVRR